MSDAPPPSAGASSLRTAPSYAGKWSTLRPPLSPFIRSLLADLQFAQMTPVQASTIPLFLAHKDVVVEAVTGSGKTLAFVVPVLEMLLRRAGRLKKDEVGALIVSPTRELAEQIHGVVEMFLAAQEQAVDEEQIDEEGEGEESDSDSDSDSDTPARTPSKKPPASRQTRISGAQLVVGGSKATPLDDYRLFRDTGPDILIGTPGRLEELLARKGVKKGALEVLVLDEADRLLDLGFTDTLHRILSLLPKQRRTGLFSATMTDALGELVRMGLRNPVRVVVKVEAKSSSAAAQQTRTPASLHNMYLVTRPQHKLAQLVRVLLAERRQGARKFIVYFATCAQVNYFALVLHALLRRERVALHALHGKQTPSKRKSSFDAFVTSASGGTGATVLFCTDVAARGLDLPDVEVVVQYDPPVDPKVFSHRCGRTARAGRRGRAIVMLHAGREEDLVAYLGVKRIPLAPYPYLNAHLEPGAEPERDAAARELEDQIRTMSLADREVFDSSLRAFVSYVRAYSRHEMAYIFRMADLDLGAVARAFGLIRLPAMPELRAQKAKGLVYDEVQGVDFANIPFKDKVKERARLAKVEEARVAKAKEEAKQEEGEGGGSDISDSDADGGSKKVGNKRRKKASSGEAWSAQKERKEHRAVRKEKRAAKRAFLKTHPNGQPAKNDDEGEEEEDDWNEEYRKLKKQKRQARRATGTQLDEDNASDSDDVANDAPKDEPFFVI